MKYLFAILLLVTSYFSKAQAVNIDSLIKATEVMKDDSSKFENLFTICNYYRLTKIDYAKAKGYAEQSVLVAKKANFQFGVALGFITSGYCSREMGLKEAAIVQLKNAIGVFENTSLALPKQQYVYTNHIACYTSISDIYSSTRDFKTAESYANKALVLAEKYQTGVGKCFMSLSTIFSEQNNNEEAKAYAKKALAEFKQNKNPSDIGRAYSFLARYQYIDNDFESAIVNYELALEAYKQAKNNSSIGGTLYNIAQTYLKLNAIDKAEVSLEEIKKYTNPAKDVVFLSFISKFTFNLYIAKKDYHSALTFCKDILEYAQKEKSPNNIRAAYEKYLIVYLGLKDTANAYIVSEKIGKLKDSTYQADIAKNTSELAKKYETEKQQQQIAFLDKEAKLNQEKLAKETLLAEALKSENELKAASLKEASLLSEALQRENELKDNEIEQKRIIQEGLERTNALEKKDLLKQATLNNSLQRENALMQANSKKEQAIRWLMIAALVGFTAFGINYYSSYRQQKKTNAQIVKQSEELTVLMREVHHRVKNNLQLMVSMLRMQARNIDDSKAIEALVNSESRLQSIAILHEKLYKSTDIGHISLKEYLDELMQVLQQQHHTLVPNFRYTVTDSTALTTNLDTAIPLGMIVNELVTNAFKYAFAKVANPTINIQLELLKPNEYQLAIADNGPGLNNGELSTVHQSMGLKLVHLFAEQLDGAFNYTKASGFIVNFKIA
jgi:two-component sensor histidine kinase